MNRQEADRYFNKVLAMDAGAKQALLSSLFGYLEVREDDFEWLCSKIDYYSSVWEAK